MNHDLVEQIAFNAELLTRAARIANPLAPGSHLRGVIDHGGPFWSTAVDDYMALTPGDRDWVLELLPKAAEQASHLLVEDDRTQRYISLRSEVRMNRLDDAGAGCIADLVGLTRDGRIVLVDLKFTASHFPIPDGRQRQNESQVRTQMRLARESLRLPGSTRCTRKVEGWLLYVSYLNNESAWVRVTA